LSPTQQPLQFEASHLPVPHVRCTGSHERPCSEQSVQLAPERPHALESVPARHLPTPPSKLQQPPGHSLGPQFCETRAQTLPLATSHCWKPVAMQSEQRWPVEPHARVSDPTRQTPLASQQPLGQFDGPQVFGGTTLASGGVSTSRLERPHPGARRTRNSAAKTASTIAWARARAEREEASRRSCPKESRRISEAFPDPA
jgi:hypothetical protein